jgi:hypothetical protein
MRWADAKERYDFDPAPEVDEACEFLDARGFLYPDHYTLKDCITVAGGLILKALIEQPK